MVAIVPFHPFVDIVLNVTWIVSFVLIAAFSHSPSWDPESNGLPTSTYYEISKYSIIKIKFSIVYIYIFDVIGIGPANYPWLAEWNDDIEVKCVQGMVQGKF